MGEFLNQDNIMKPINFTTNIVFLNGSHDIRDFISQESVLSNNFAFKFKQTFIGEIYIVS